MNKNLKSIVEEDLERGESRMTRLLKSDDNIVTQRKGAGSTYSLVIADLVHKGLAYEALEKGAGDPVIRNLLRTLDSLIQHRVQEACGPLLEAVNQNQLFTAALFITITNKLNFPINNSDQQQLDTLYDSCAEQANEMLSLIMPPPPSTEHPAEITTTLETTAATTV